MALTPAQRVTLKSFIDADGTLSAFPVTSDGSFEVARLLNLVAAPDFWIWRTSVTKAEIVSGVSTDPDGVTTRSFSWTGAGFITRNQGERDAWRELFSVDGTVDASQSNVRTAFADIFSGATAPAPSNRQHLLNVGRRKATVAEKVFAVGSGTAASPATASWQGELTYQDVQAARIG